MSIDKRNRRLPGFARNIRAARCGRALTQERLAERAKLSEQTILRAEKGEKVSLGSFAKIAVALNMSVEEIIRDTERRAFVVRIMNLKGGVGRTAICANLASLLAADGFKVLLLQVA